MDKTGRYTSAFITIPVYYCVKDSTGQVDSGCEFKNSVPRTYSLTNNTTALYKLGQKLGVR